MRVRSSLCAAVVVFTLVAMGVVSAGSSWGAIASPSSGMSPGEVRPSGVGVGDPNLGTLNQGTRTVNFDDGWRFRLVNADGVIDPSGIYGNSSAPKADAISFDDSSWEHVTLPHDWSITLAPDPSQTNSTGYFPGGLGWYRKTFSLPRWMSGKEISIDFDGVFDNSYVYLNGHLVGNHPYGYTGYSYEVTKLVHTGGTPNVLAVVVQNQEPSSRWYSGSGITRHVHLTVVNPVHIARWGTFVTTPELSTSIKSGYAHVHVATKLANDSAKNKTVDIVYKVKDATGAVVARSSARRVAVAAGGATNAADIRVEHPTLWSTTHPYLYTLKTEVRRGGATVDSTSTTFGIRWIVFDSNKGALVNGHYVKLHGVDLHNDEGALGSVDNYDALWRQMSILKRMGVNAFRTSHNPPSPEMIDVCQRLGILMMVEAFDTWDVSGFGKVQYDYHLYFNRWSDYDIKEMVNEARNSPAVVMWSVGNEIPGWGTPPAVPVEKRLIADIRSIDTTRPVVAGSDRYRSVPAAGSPAEQMLENLDGLGLNYDIAQTVDGLHTNYPNTFFFESESSSETSTRGYYQDPNLLNTGQNFTPGKQELSSYDNNLDDWTLSGEYSLKKDRDRQFFTGQFVWSGFDYIGEPTPYTTFPVKTSFFGLVDTAGFPKDQYYLFKSQWNRSPMVHIVPMNWSDWTPGQAVQVRTYANEPTVQLFLNGVSLGAKSFDQKVTRYGLRYLETTECGGDDKNYTTGACPGSYESPNGSSGNLHLTWTVPFRPGRLVAVAKDASGKVVARDEVHTADKPYALRLTPDKTVLLDDGESLSYVKIDVVDAHGFDVPDADNTIDVNVTGAGTFQGADNGKEDDAEGYKSTTHNAFNGKLLAIVESGTSPGTITVTASSGGLRRDTTTLYSSPARSSGLIAIEPVYVRSKLGAHAALPPKVTSVRANGETESLPVSWSAIPGRASSETGIYKIDGKVPGTGIQANAILTVYEVGGIETYSTAVPVGTPPPLPPTVKVTTDDGVTQYLPVTWAAISPSEYSAPGQFTVTGMIAGTSMRADASIRVTGAFTPNQNLALASGPLHPIADASFSGGFFTGYDSDFGTSTTLPAEMLNGSTASGAWSNRYSKVATQTLPTITTSHPNDWVSVAWPNAQHFSEVDAYFTTDANNELPTVIAVSYWNGLTWVPVSGQHVSFASASNTPTTITFEPISATKVKLGMRSASPNDPVTGNLTIAELAIPGTVVAYNTTAALSSLEVDGHTVAGFSPTVHTYTVHVAATPTISATAADNGRVLVVPALSIPGTASVTVTSEDGQHQSTYTLDLMH